MTYTNIGWLRRWGLNYNLVTGYWLLVNSYPVETAKIAIQAPNRVQRRLVIPRSWISDFVMPDPGSGAGFDKPALESFSPGTSRSMHE